MEFESLRDVLVEQLQDLYSAEQQLSINPDDGGACCPPSART
jgi:hypothetical protein